MLPSTRRRFAGEREPDLDRPITALQAATVSTWIEESAASVRENATI